MSDASSGPIDIFTVASVTTDSTGYPGITVASSELTLPSITGEGVTYWVGEIPMLTADGTAVSGAIAFSSVDVLLPLVQGTAGAGAGGSVEVILRPVATGEALPNRVGTSSVSLTSLTANSQADGASLHLATSVAQIAAITGQSEAASGRFASSAVSLTSLTGSSTATTQEVKTAASSQALPLITPESAGTPERLGTSSIQIRVITGTGDGITEGVTATGDSAASSARTLPSVSGSGDGLLERLAASSLALAPLAAESTAFSGATSADDALATSSAALPAITEVSSGLTARLAASAANLPRITGSGAAQTAGAGADDRSASSTAQLPALAASSSGASGRFASSAASLRLPAGDGAGVSAGAQDSAAGSQATLVAISGSGSGLHDRLSSSQATIPTITGSASGATGVSASDSTAASTDRVLVAGAVGQGLSGRLAASAANLPSLSGQAGAEVEGAAADDRLAASSAIVLPIDAAGYAFTQRLAQSSQAVHAVQADSSAATGRAASSSASTPAIIGVSGAGGYDFSYAWSKEDLSALSGAGAAVSDSIATSDQTVASLQPLGVAASVQLTSSVFLPIVEVQGAAATGRAGQSIATISLPVSSGQATASMLAGSELELPIISATSAAAAIASGASMLVLPAWVVNSIATGGQAIPGAGQAAEGRGYMLNTGNLALTESSGASFNSYAWMGDVLLAANEDGLFVIGGASDNGTAIDSSMTFPINPEDAQLRRLSKLVVGYRNDGDLRLTVSTDGGENYEYVLEQTGRDECHPNRVRIGRGIKGRYWSMTVENIDGADFALDALDADWEILSRRVP